LGAHLSIAGGLPRAVERAQAAGCRALQIFTKSVGQWRARPLPEEEVREFRRRAAAARMHAIGHNSYLINVAAADARLRERSCAALAEELDRAEALGLRALVMHPGSFTTLSEEEGLRNVAAALRGLVAARRGGRTKILLEHTAGQGTNLGHRFEHLAEIIDRAGGTRRIGVCLDTCHLVAAGYDITTPAGYEHTIARFDDIVGLDRLEAIHLNDSKRPCGSRVDRHEHIGRGCIGLEGFARVVNDARFSGLPMVIETPKSDAPGDRRLPVDPWDEENLGTLRSLIRAPRPARRRRAPRT
jgi:deoxyribonuclease-4